MEHGLNEELKRIWAKLIVPTKQNNIKCIDFIGS